MLDFRRSRRLQGPKQIEDLRLLGARSDRSAAAATGVAAREVQRRRSVPVLLVWIGAAFEQRAYGCGAACADRAMERCGTTGIRRIGIGSRTDQDHYRPDLRA